MATTEIREFAAQARSSDTAGRVLCQAREQHFVIDGPVWNGFPGEAMNPGEAFIAGISACAVELIQMFAAADELEIGKIDVQIKGLIDRENPLREDLTIFNELHTQIEIEDVTEDEAKSLAEHFAARCPLYGSVAASGAELNMEVRAG